MKIEWKSCFRLCISLFGLFLAVHYWDSIADMGLLFFGAARSLILGCIIAYILNILMSFYERIYFKGSKNKIVQKSRRAVCLIAAMVTLVAVVLLVIGLVIPELADCVRLLSQEIPETLQQGVQWLRDNEIAAEFVEEDVLASLASINWQEKVGQVIRVLLEGVGGFAQAAVTVATSLISHITTFVIGTIFAIYLLFGKERLASQMGLLMERYGKEEWNRRFCHVIGTVNHCFHKFIVGQCTEAVILGVLCMVSMWILRFPYEVMIGTLIGFTALIPVAGAYIGAAVGAFMIFTVSPVKALAFLVFIVILQQVEGNLIYPRVVGTSIGLPGVWVLAAVTLGGGVMGIPGMLIGVPLTSAVYQLVKQDVKRDQH